MLRVVRRRLSDKGTYEQRPKEVSMCPALRANMHISGKSLPDIEPHKRKGPEAGISLACS